MREGYQKRARPTVPGAAGRAAHAGVRRRTGCRSRYALRARIAAEESTCAPPCFEAAGQPFELVDDVEIADPRPGRCACASATAASATPT